MWELRLILILIGAVFIAAVYLLSRQKKGRSRGLHDASPKLEAADLPDIRTSPPPDPPSPLAPGPESDVLDLHSQDDPKAASKQLILALHVACRENSKFSGRSVLEALQAAGLNYGQYRVFHRMTKDNRPQSVFSVASMVEPGVLDPEVLPRMQIPGLTLFLVLPGPQDAVAACADMLATARNLAARLGGEVLDDSRKELTVQAAQRIREQILQFQQTLSIPSSPSSD